MALLSCVRLKAPMLSITLMASMYPLPDNFVVPAHSNLGWSCDFLWPVQCGRSDVTILSLGLKKPCMFLLSLWLLCGHHNDMSELGVAVHETTWSRAVSFHQSQITQLPGDLPPDYGHMAESSQNLIILISRLPANL